MSGRGGWPGAVPRHRSTRPEECPGPPGPLSPSKMSSVATGGSCFEDGQAAANRSRQPGPPFLGAASGLPAVCATHTGVPKPVELVQVGSSMYGRRASMPVAHVHGPRMAGINVLTPALSAITRPVATLNDAGFGRLLSGRPARPKARGSHGPPCGIRWCVALSGTHGAESASTSCWPVALGVGS